MTDFAPYNRCNQRDHAYTAQQDLIAAGLNNDWEVVVATKDQLQIDYDSPEVPRERFDKALELLEKRLGQPVVRYTITQSKSGNRHAIIDMPKGHDLTIYERVGWQAIFGSDILREGLHYVDIKKNEANPILLFERIVPPAPKLLTA